MRIRSISVEKILHFDEFSLDLQSDRGLHVIHGSNEAGKSTLLRLVTDMLFGGRVVDDGVYTNQSRLYATLASPLAAAEETAAGQTASSSRATTPVSVNSTDAVRVIRRRKSRQLMLEAPDANFDEETLAEWLKGFDRERYMLLFGLHHERLREGGESLLQSGGHLGISLFEAGGGVQSLQSILTSLTARTQDLLDDSFRSNSNKRLNAALREHRALVQEARLSALRGDEFLQKKHDVEVTRGRLADLQQQHAALQQGVSRLSRITRVRTMVANLEHTRQELDEYLDFQELTMTDDERLTQLLDTLNHLQTDLARQRQDERYFTDQLGKVVVDDGLLAVQEDVRLLQERLNHYQQAKDKLPALDSQLASVRLSLREALTNLHVSLSTDDVEGLRIPMTDERHIRQLATDWETATKEHNRLLTETLELDERMKLLTERLAALGEVPDTAVLRRTLGVVRQLGDIEKALIDTEVEIRDRQERAKASLASQTIWSGNLPDVAILQVPLLESISRFEDELVRTQQLLDSLKREVEQKAQELERVEEFLEQQELLLHVPNESELKAARQHRDEGWQLLKRILQDGDSTDLTVLVSHYSAGETLEHSYESAVVHADDVVDNMRRNSDQVAQRAQAELQKTRLVKSLDDLATKMVAVEAQLQAWTESWETAWQDSGIRPSSPSEMRSFLVEYVRPLKAEWEAVHALEKAQEARNQLYLTRMEDLRGTLLAIQGLSQSTQSQVKEASTLSILTQLSEAVLAFAEERERRRAAASQQLTITEETRERRHSELQSLRTKMEGLQRDWHTLKSRYTTLPEKPTLAVDYLEHVRRIVDLWEALRRLEQDRRTLQDTCQKFEQDAQSLWNTLLRENATQLPVSSQVRLLISELDAAQRAEAKREEVLGALQRIEATIGDLNVKAATADSELARFLVRLACDDTGQLRHYIEKSRAKRELQRSVQTIEGALLESGDGLPIAQLIREVAEGPNPDELPVVTESRRRELSDLASEEQELQKTLWSMQEELNKLDGTLSTAADLSQQAEYRLADIDRLWNEYVRLHLANRLLRRAIEKFREDNESSILARASALFARLTLDRYHELVVDYEGNAPVLQVVTREGDIRNLDVLSDGTRDQLFLALRLAFIEQHLERVGPLPVVLDDILIHFDDERSRATLQILSELGNRTQVLYFTHHRFLVDSARSLQHTGSTSGERSSRGVYFYSLEPQLSGKEDEK